MSNLNHGAARENDASGVPETVEAAESSSRVIDIGERFQHRLAAIGTMLDQQGWTFSIQGEVIPSTDVLARNGLLPMLVWSVIVARKAQGLPSPDVFLMEAPGTLCEVAVYQDVTHGMGSTPWDEWILELLIRERCRAALIQGRANGTMVLGDFYDTWYNDVQEKAIVFRPKLDPKDVDPLVLARHDHTSMPLRNGPPEPSMTVCTAPSPILQGKDEWAVLTTPLPLKTVTTNLGAWQDALNERFPWMRALTARLFRSLYVQQRGGHPLRLPCLALLGEPGFGKTLYLSEALRLLNHPWTLLNLAGSNDSVVIKGTTAGWSSARPSFPSITVVTTRCANPVIVLDEIDKAGGSDENGRATDALLPMLEPGTAPRYMDDGLMSTVDLSRISWLMTLNDETLVPGPLRSRMEIVPVDGPDWGNPEHLDAVLRMGEDLAWLQWPGQRATACELTHEQKNDLRRVRWKSLRNLGTTIRSMIENNLYHASLQDLPETSLDRFQQRLAAWRAGGEGPAPENTP